MRQAAGTSLQEMLLLWQGSWHTESERRQICRKFSGEFRQSLVAACVLSPTDSHLTGVAGDGGSAPTTISGTQVPRNNMGRPRGSRRTVMQNTP